MVNTSTSRNEATASSEPSSERAKPGIAPSPSALALVSGNSPIVCPEAVNNANPPPFEQTTRLPLLQTDKDSSGTHGGIRRRRSLVCRLTSKSSELSSITRTCCSSDALGASYGAIAWIQPPGVYVLTPASAVTSDTPGRWRTGSTSDCVLSAPHAESSRARSGASASSRRATAGGRTCLVALPTMLTPYSVTEPPATSSRASQRPRMVLPSAISPLRQRTMASSSGSHSTASSSPGSSCWPPSAG